MALSETPHIMLRGVLFGPKERGVKLRESPNTEPYELQLPARKGSEGDALILNETGVLEFAPASEQSGTSYTHQQTASSALWVITHNLGYHPSVTVVDSAGSVVIGDVTFLSVNVLKIEFTGGFSGFAYLS